MRLRTPAEIRERAPGERVLDWLPSGSSWLVVTDASLVLPEGAAVGRIPWDLVLRVHWDDAAVEVTAQDGPGGRAVLHRVALGAELGSFPEIVRERVNASIVVQHHVPIVSERGVRLVARRAPGTTDLRWSVVFDAGLDPTDPALRDQADAALAELRASLGV